MPRILQHLRIAVVALSALGSLLLADAAEAASCRAMKAELASLSGAVGSARYAKAAKRQRSQLRRVEKLMRSHSCRSRRSSACTTLRGSYRKMERNLRTLSRRADRQGSKVKRRLLRRRIARRCDEFRSTDDRMRARIAGREVPKRKAVAKRSPKPRRLRKGRTFATMCVRLCDGFAFPVSLSTAPKQFAKDAEACPSRCPGVDMRLYAAPAANGSVANARDVETGEPYSELSTAFRHRKVYDRACTCRFGREGRLDLGTPIETPQKIDPVLKPAPKVRIVGSDYFAAE